MHCTYSNLWIYIYATLHANTMYILYVYIYIYTLVTVSIRYKCMIYLAIILYQFMERRWPYIGGTRSRNPILNHLPASSRTFATYAWRHTVTQRRSLQLLKVDGLESYKRIVSCTLNTERYTFCSYIYIYIYIHTHMYRFVYIHTCFFLWTCMTSLTGNCGISPQFWGYLKNWFALCTPPYVFVSPDLLDISLGLFRWQKQLEVGSCACQCPSARMVSRPRGPTVWTRRPANCVVEPLYKCHVVAQSAQYGRACECWRWKPLVHLSIFPTAAAIKHIVFPSTSHLIQDTLSLHLYNLLLTSLMLEFCQLFGRVSGQGL